MMKMVFDRPRDAPFQILVVGAHSDDIEIGCGGTILRLAREFPQLEVHWVVFGGTSERQNEARRSAEDFLVGVRHKTVIVKGYRDGYLPFRGEQIKDDFEQLKATLNPDLIFTHHRDDRHQDHRLISDMAWNTFRDHMILEYEVPKYDGDLGSPNFFVHLDKETCTKKVSCILEYFVTQGNKHWFTMETFFALLRLRGVESKSPGGYAEGFYCRKVSF